MQAAVPELRVQMQTKARHEEQGNVKSTETKERAREHIGERVMCPL